MYIKTESGWRPLWRPAKPVNEPVSWSSLSGKQTIDEYNELMAERASFEAAQLAQRVAIWQENWGN